MESKTVTLDQINALVEKIGTHGIIDILSGKAHVSEARHIINLDANPRDIDTCWYIKEHTKGEQFTWDPKRVYLLEYDCSIRGNIVHEKTRHMPVLNANLFDYLVENPKIIPNDGWKYYCDGGKYTEDIDYSEILFMGTIYATPDPEDVYLYVRCLYFDNGHWMNNLKAIMLDPTKSEYYDGKSEPELLGCRVAILK